MCVEYKCLQCSLMLMFGCSAFTARGPRQSGTRPSQGPDPRIASRADAVRKKGRSRHQTRMERETTNMRTTDADAEAHKKKKKRKGKRREKIQNGRADANANRRSRVEGREKWNVFLLGEGDCTHHPLTTTSRNEKLKSSHVHGGVGAARSEGCQGGRAKKTTQNGGKAKAWDGEEKRQRYHEGARQGEVQAGGGRAPVAFCPAIRHPRQCQLGRAQPQLSARARVRNVEGRDEDRKGKGKEERDEQEGWGRGRGRARKEEIQTRRCVACARNEKNAKHGNASPMRGPRLALPGSDPDGESRDGTKAEEQDGAAHAPASMTETKRKLERQEGADTNTVPFATATGTSSGGKPTKNMGHAPARHTYHENL
ncbi:hypothetical protein K438DRAFT_1931320 [Mycena galopus ATCC 62051]|nr:hypothetical protein K438DRAFT_1931320 [Mycena galopus ATCC 62051]